MSASPVVIGIDPGLAKVGWAVVGDGVIAAGRFNTTPADGTDTERIAKIALWLMGTIKDHDVAAVAVETQHLDSGSRGTERDAKSYDAQGVAACRGAVAALCALTGLPVYEVAPSTAKKALTGNGRASKEQMRAMAQAIFPKGVRVSFDAADAAGIARAGQNRWKDANLQQRLAGTSAVRD